MDNILELQNSTRILAKRKFWRSNLSDTSWVGNKMSAARERTFSLGLTDTHKQTQVTVNSVGGYNGIRMVKDYKQLGSLKT